MSEYEYVNLPPEIEEIIDDLEIDFERNYKRAALYGFVGGIFITLFVVLVTLVILVVI